MPARYDTSVSKAERFIYRPFTLRSSGRQQRRRDLTAPPAPPAPRQRGASGSATAVAASSGDAVPLHEAAQTRYLNYALSVITSRALPDVRDGLKPVQRRILYHDVAAEPDRRRQAPQVRQGRRRRDGQLPPARRRGALRDAGAHGAAVLAALSARRRLGQLRLARRRQRRGVCATPSAGWRGSADELLTEIDQDTVAFRPNYDGTKTEPVVLPARIPNLLINGATGIAVGMATNIPPHNLGEVCTALIKLARERRADQRAAVPLGEGPGLPHRRPDPQLARRAEGDLQHRHGAHPSARHVGSGAGDARRARRSTSPAFPTPSTSRSSSSASPSRRVAASCRRCSTCGDVSTDDVRIELELKKDADEKMVMAYLFKHTPLQINVQRQPHLPGADGERPKSAGPSGSISRRSSGTSSTSGSRW